MIDEKNNFNDYLLLNNEERLKEKVIIIDLNSEENVDETIKDYKLNEKAKNVLKAYLKELLRKEEGRI